MKITLSKKESDEFFKKALISHFGNLLPNRDTWGEIEVDVRSYETVIEVHPKATQEEVAL